LERPYTPKADTPTRRTLVIDETDVPVPIGSWTISLIAVERGRPDLVDQVLEGYAQRNLRIAHFLTDCGVVVLLAVVWTLKPEERAFYYLRRKGGPLDPGAPGGKR
jgi:hypothetical protein